jgi:hypothetical protein
MPGVGESAAHVRALGVLQPVNDPLEQCENFPVAAVTEFVRGRHTGSLGALVRVGIFLSSFRDDPILSVDHYRLIFIHRSNPYGERSCGVCEAPRYCGCQLVERAQR